LEEQPAFHSFALAESGEIDVDAVRQEVVAAGIRVVERDRQVGAILLECSLMPPYGAALQEELQLPVFDYITMINYVFSAVVKKDYHGFI
jgi:Asp/Glu/hydantoin racemase